MNHLCFAPSFNFCGTALGRFCQCFFYIFCRRSTMVIDIFTQPPPTIKKLPTALYWHHWTYSTTPRNMIFVRILFVLIYVNLTLCRNSIQFTFFLVMRLNIIIVTEGASFIIILAWNVASKNIWIIKLVLIFNIFLKYVILPLFYKEVVWNSFPL